MSIRNGFVLVAVILFLFFLFMSWRWFDPEEILLRLHTLVQHPRWLVMMFGAYLLSFMLKAEAWRMYSGSQGRFRVYYHGMIYSLLVNHLLPIKVGDIVRTGFMMKNMRKTWDEALHSVGMMRLMDMFVLGAISLTGVAYIGLSVSWRWIIIILSVMVLLAFFTRFTLLQRLPFVRKHWLHFKSIMLSRKGLSVMLLITLSWILEAAVIYGVAIIMKLGLGAAPLVWANSVTIAGQVLHITPGGIGTYESTLSSSLAILGVDWKDAYAAAILSHTFKFAFSYLAGGYTLMRMPIRWSEAKIWLSRKQKPAKESTSS